MERRGLVVKMDIEPLKVSPTDPLLNQLNHFADIIESNVDPIVSIEDGFKKLGSCQLHQKSSDLGKPLLLNIDYRVSPLFSKYDPDFLALWFIVFLCLQESFYNFSHLILLAAIDLLLHSNYWGWKITLQSFNFQGELNTLTVLYCYWVYFMPLLSFFKAYLYNVSSLCRLSVRSVNYLACLILLLNTFLISFHG